MKKIPTFFMELDKLFKLIWKRKCKRKAKKKMLWKK